jgi:hypothetical protein
MWTLAARTRSRTWTDLGRGCGRGQDMVADWLWTRTVRGCGLVSDWTRAWTGQGHGQQAGLWRGYVVSKPRPRRGRRTIVLTRSKACPTEKPSGEGSNGGKCATTKGDKLRQIRCRLLPQFVTGADAARFVDRMVKGMVSSENCPRYGQDKREKFILMGCWRMLRYCHRGRALESEA